MTDNQKQQIKQYRDQGLSYSEISRMLGISVNSVKTYCKRHALGGAKAFDKKPSTQFCCEQCGKHVKQNPGRKKKRFCSDSCRMKSKSGVSAPQTSSRMVTPVRIVTAAAYSG